jgi:uncharacterized damage-inducible protein DinB
MSTDAPLDILLAHDRWATSQLLGAAQSLSDSQLDQHFEIGLGSLRATLMHIIDVQRLWTESLNGKEGNFQNEKLSIQEMIQRHEKAAAELDAAAHGTPLDVEFNQSWKGTRYSFPRAGVLMHVLMHGTHHRAQALNMMRHLGVSPLPPSSVLQWMFSTGVGKKISPAQ